MDARNTFETPQTARLARLEWGGLLALCAVLLLVHLDEIDWPSFVALFVVIDLIGYIPGAIAYRRSANHVLPKAYYVLYNTMHCLFTWTVLLGAAVVLVGWQWFMLAVPLHLLGDRALFGNSLKPYGVSFEPKTHPAFAEFLRRYSSAPAPWRPAGDETGDATGDQRGAGARPADTDRDDHVVA